MTEADFLAALRRLPLHAGAGGLADDVAVIGDLVVTTDTLVEGVHYLPGDPPGDVAWKLLAVNLSDLAAKGAAPMGALLNYPLGADDWDRAFLSGLETALTRFDCPLLGGDTVSLPSGASRVLTLTVLGKSDFAPARNGARAGDILHLCGMIGDAGAGLAIARGQAGPAELLAVYRRPQPLLAEGRALAPLVHAMMDVSDGVLIDAARMAAASGLAATIDLALLPLSPAYRDFAGNDRDARLAAATAGDDYALLFATAADTVLPAPATAIGRLETGSGLHLVDAGAPIPLPVRLGFEH